MVVVAAKPVIFVTPVTIKRRAMSVRARTWRKDVLMATGFG